MNPSRLLVSIGTGLYHDDDRPYEIVKDPTSGDIFALHLFHTAGTSWTECHPRPKGRPDA